MAEHVEYGDDYYAYLPEASGLNIADSEPPLETGIPEMEDGCLLPRPRLERRISPARSSGDVHTLIDIVTAADVPLDVVADETPLDEGEVLIEPGVIVDLSDLGGGQESRPDEATTRGAVIPISEIQERVSTPTRRGILGLLGRVAAGIASIAGSRS